MVVSIMESEEGVYERAETRRLKAQIALEQRKKKQEKLLKLMPQTSAPGVHSGYTDLNITQEKKTLAQNGGSGVNQGF